MIVVLERRRRRPGGSSSSSSSTIIVQARSLMPGRAAVSVSRSSMKTGLFSSSWSESGWDIRASVGSQWCWALWRRRPLLESIVRSIINPKRSIIHPLKQLTSTNMTPLATLQHRLDAGPGAEQERDLSINRRRLPWFEEPVSGRKRRDESIHEKSGPFDNSRPRYPPKRPAPVRQPSVHMS
jgi:hypothetical protein